MRGVDLILDNGKELVRNTSTVIRLTDEEPEIIRQGEEDIEW
ncbi:MAG: Sua5/YciO/YrdC/YwlC family protein [Spirochaetales bacterium]|nr:Sua5/YciO/YrdC/YwlC family protein [Spirochaetales bacterium]